MKRSRVGLFFMAISILVCSGCGNSTRDNMIYGNVNLDYMESNYVYNMDYLERVYDTLSILKEDTGIMNYVYAEEIPEDPLMLLQSLNNVNNTNSYIITDMICVDIGQIVTIEINSYEMAINMLIEEGIYVENSIYEQSDVLENGIAKKEDNGLVYFTDRENVNTAKLFGVCYSDYAFVDALEEYGYTGLREFMKRTETETILGRSTEVETISINGIIFVYGLDGLYIQIPMSMLEIDKKYNSIINRNITGTVQFNNVCHGEKYDSLEMAQYTSRKANSYTRVIYEDMKPIEIEITLYSDVMDSDLKNVIKRFMVDMEIADADATSFLEEFSLDKAEELSSYCNYSINREKVEEQEIYIIRIWR